jgi:carbon monoxide dehydrogenase subunit G
VTITMRDRFLVRAPIDDVWEFLMDSRRVVLCMPGAHLEQIESDRAYLASVKVAVGPFTTSYKGRVEFAEADESLHRARLTAEGQERGGGAAHGSMVSSLRTVEEGPEVIVDVSFARGEQDRAPGAGLDAKPGARAVRSVRDLRQGATRSPAGGVVQR